MSFSSNPYQHMDVLSTDNGLAFFLQCESCGWDSESGGAGEHDKRIFYNYEPIGAMRMVFDEHILKSHDRKPEDFKGWSKF